MIVKNEAHSPYIERVLESVRDIVDSFVVLDDKSNDGGATKFLFKSYPKVIFHESSFDVSMYPINEPKLREVQWEKVREVAKKGDWILVLDADEEMDKSFAQVVDDLTKGIYDWYRFRILDMWSPTHFRVDGMWSPVKEIFFRYQDEPANLPAGVNHIPLLPQYILQSHNGIERRDVKIIHWGWADEAKRLAKQKFYLDGRAVGFDLEHAKSVTTSVILEELKIEKMKGDLK
jgi:glycosyltransferase involved in cell wall biosynthesis